MAPTHVVADQSEVFTFLSQSRAHGVTESVTRIDTHGAVVFLAGPNAYKVKRAVRFPFMDFSTLEKRRAACEAEVAVNRPNAPALYHGTVPITRSSESLALAAEGETIEWAVHMCRFDVDDTLDRVAAAGRLSQVLVAKLTRAVLASHAKAPRREGASTIASIERYIRENHDAFMETPELFPPDRVARLTNVAGTAFAEMRALLRSRCQAGFIRRCHGDLHLRNLVLLAGEPTLFDAIEFDEAIATGDVLYELAFLLMDLWERELPATANLVLNRYLWESDEVNLEGLAARPLFLAVRAGIRAKVVAAGLPHLSGRQRERGAAQAVRYFECAERFLVPAAARVIAVGGLSGTGKSTLAASIAPNLGRAPGAIHLRSDIERKRLFGVPETEPLPAEAYGHVVTAQIYSCLKRKVELVAHSGSSVVVDAVYAQESERLKIEDMARQLRIPFVGLWLEAPQPALMNRLEHRRGDASDADAAILERQSHYDLGVVSWRRVDALLDPDGLSHTILASLS
jgi:aminoglycoside phosphotransferase family enzyme/predicted kinase